MEIWKKIPNAETYEVSSRGNIRRALDAPNAINTHQGRVLRPDFASGYARVTLRHNGKMERALIHRLVARAFLDETAPFTHVNHKDGNKLNNKVENLEWCSSKENTQHAWRIGLCRPLIGDKNGNTKLKDRDIEVIRDARIRKINISEIASVFNVSQATVSKVCRFKTRK